MSERELGQLQSDMKHANENMERIEEKLDGHIKASSQNQEKLESKMDEQFTKIEALLNEGKGAWKVIIFVAGIVSSLATFLVAKLLAILFNVK